MGCPKFGHATLCHGDDGFELTLRNGSINPGLTSGFGFGESAQLEGGGALGRAPHFGQNMSQN